MLKIIARDKIAGENCLCMLIYRRRNIGVGLQRTLAPCAAYIAKKWAYLRGLYERRSEIRRGNWFFLCNSFKFKDASINLFKYCWLAETSFVLSGRNLSKIMSE